MITANSMRSKQKKLKELQRKEDDYRSAVSRGEVIPESKMTLKKVEELLTEKIHDFIGYVYTHDKLKDSVVKSLKKAGYKVYLCKIHNTYSHKHMKNILIKPATFWRTAVYETVETVDTHDWYNYNTVIVWDVDNIETVMFYDDFSSLDIHEEREWIEL